LDEAFRLAVGARRVGACAAVFEVQLFAGVGEGVHKKVQRVYRELGLSVKRTRRKHLRRTLQPRPVWPRAVDCAIRRAW
jgi:hypothetical protein